MKHLNAILYSYSEILFIRSRWSGFLLFLITLLNPYVSLGGIVSVLSAYTFARLINMDNEFLKEGFYTYNPLLTGLSVGYLFSFTPLTILFMVITGILTFVTTIFLSSIFSYYLKLPVLSMPFVIISSLAYMASTQYSNLFVTGLYNHTYWDIQLTFGFWIDGYFKSIGAIFFMPNVVTGIIIASIVLALSRIHFLLSILGYYIGTLVIALMVGSFEQSFSDINHFNFILISMVVGGIFLVPSPKSYLIAIIAVCTSTVLLDAVLVFWSNYGIPAFTLPFNIISLSFIYVLGVVKFPQMAYLIKDTPEETIDLYLSNKDRYRGSWITIMLPFAGKWTVYQGFNGKWTHQGGWRYAYDFIITDEDGKSFKNEGNLATDYYCFKKPVLSPIRGRVVKVVNNLPDVEIGTVDKVNNWGNLIIIKDERNFYVEISHLAEDSIKLEEGAWVERGTMLGLCGNSGYSPQPHIHIQVQEVESIGAYTIPFSFVNFMESGVYHSNDLPELDAIVEPLHVDLKYDSKTSFVLDDVFEYKIIKNETEIDRLNLTVKMALDGTFYLDSGKGKLYFGKHEGTFYFYSSEGNDKYLNAIFQSLPRFPLTYRENLTWSDTIPVGRVLKAVPKAIVQFLISFVHNAFKINVNLKFSSPTKITSKISSKVLKVNRTAELEFSDQVGFKSIKVEDIELRRIESASNTD
ncbi:MAG: urea transporter [Melioribacteraceae bacterium]|nr:urea transporter [Melioribacteraceae bacterium]